MKISKSHRKKIVLIILSFVVLTVVIIFLLISPITKYLIEKYDEQYTGRQIKIGWIYVNPFTGYFHINHLKIYESKSPNTLVISDSVFLSADELNIDFALYKLFSKTIEIAELTLIQPKGNIIQNKKDFNYNDIIKRFTPDKSDTTPSIFHFNILHIKISNGEIYYREQVIPVYYSIKDLDIESTGMYWNSDTIAATCSFLSGIGSGRAHGNFTINIKNLDYRLAAFIQEYDLKFIEQYLKEFTNYGTFRAKLNANIKAIGNFNNQEDIHAKGMVALNDFHFGKNIKDDYASFDKLIFVINELSPKKHQYLFDSVLLNQPYFKYERYDFSDNLETMFGKKGSNISAAKADESQFNLVLEIADYIKVLAKNFLRSDYQINSLAITKGCIKFNDYTLSEKLSLEMNPLFVFADSVNKNHKRVKLSFNSAFQPYGNISVAVSINPKDSSDFDMQYYLKKLPISLFNPYLISYTSFPFDRGTIDINGNWKVRNGIIKSNNHILVIDPRVAKRIKNEDAKWIPTPLIMFFIRERGNIIDYEIPITGNLKNPIFHLHDVIIDIVKNIFVKPVTTPYRIQVKNTENEIERSLTLNWSMRQNELHPNQEKFIKKIVDFLRDNPSASIAVYPMLYAEKEKEYISFFEAKKKYFLVSKEKNAQFLSNDDSLIVNKMSVKDSLFIDYLNKQVGDTMLFTIQDKCKEFVGINIINAQFKQLNKERKDAFMLPFNEDKIENRVHFYSATNSIPYNGFSFFKIVYKGELPKSLIEAYIEMNELNNKAPRKKFEKERMKIRRILKK